MHFFKTPFNGSYSVDSAELQLQRESSWERNQIMRRERERERETGNYAIQNGDHQQSLSFDAFEFKNFPQDNGAFYLFSGQVN